MKRATYVGLSLLIAAKILGADGITYRGASTSPGADSHLVLCHGTGPVTTSGTTKETLATCTIPANDIPNNYKSIEVHLFGQHKTGNANNTTLGVTLGSTDIVARVSSVSAEGIAAVLWCDYQATNTLACHGIQSISSGTTSGNIYASASLSITLTSNAPVTFFGTTGTAAGDVILHSYSVILVQ